MASPPRTFLRRLAPFAVLLCLQAAAGVLTLRRDPLDRLEGAALTALVWEATRAAQRQQAAPARRPR